MKPAKNILISIFLFILIGSCQVSQNSASTSYAIAYTSKESGNGEIYLTDAEGKSKIKITDHPNNDGYPAWSPDGKRIASYAYHDGRKTWSIHTMNIDGTNRKRLTHAENNWDNSPTWSPDGTKIAFSREYKDSEKKWQQEIWIMNSDGSELTQIKSLKGGGPHFTPDGRIVFHSEFKDKKSEISIADIDGNNIVQLTHSVAEEWHPEVSPDGKQIAFMSNRDGNHEIYVMNIDGSNQKRLTNSDEDDWYPSWSPDGSELIFSSSKDEERQVYRMNQDGTSIKPIIKHGSQAAWLKLAQETSESQFNFPPLEGPYMGQEPPGMVAVSFAPGIISKEGWEIEGVFAPGMKEFYFTTSHDEPFRPTVIGFRQQDNIWKKYIEFPRRGEVAFSPDGSRMHMAKGYKDRTGDGWSERKSIGPSFEEIQIMRLTVSSKATYVFDEVGMPDGDGIIRYSRLIDGKREAPRSFGAAINTGRMNAHPFIAPDESYIIWDGERKDGYGDSDLYISFRQKNGSWGPAINMGDKINSDKWDAFASVTPDGKYLFFNRGIDDNNDNIDIYWIDARIIDTLRPQ